MDKANEREEICYGTIIVADEQVVRGKGANIKIKRKIEQAVFKKSDIEWKGLKILDVVESKVVGYTNTSRKYTEVKVNDQTRNKITGTYE
jgi:hypothetical protein